MAALSRGNCVYFMSGSLQLCIMGAVMKDLSHIYLWFDTEYTSLNLEEACLLQVALVITDSQLNRLTPAGEDLRLYVHLEPPTTCSDWVEKNLAELLAKCRSSQASTLGDVNEKLALHLDTWLGPSPEKENQRPILAGNSIHADWFLIRKYLPALIQRIHYRLLDVSSLKVLWTQSLGQEQLNKDDVEEVKKWFPGVFSSGQQKHDAYYDVLCSIAEYNFYRRRLKLV